MHRCLVLTSSVTLCLFTFASASLFAQVTALSPPEDLITTASGHKVQLPSVSQTGIILGTVTDINDAPVSGAGVSLQGRDPNDFRSVATNENGFFEIRDVQPGVPYEVSIRAEGFAEWESPVVTLEPGQSKILDVSKLRPEEVRTAISVTPASSDQIATEQVKSEEKQRGFLIIPDFFAVYTPNPAPLTTKLKFDLAFKVARDPFTLAGVAVLAGIGQAEDNPKYVQGARGYGERFGANYANDFTNVILDGAILPSLLHQDPRYFYKGTGKTESRVFHAISSLFIAKGDDGRWQPNYSALAGDLASAAISNFYYPKSNRGVGVVFQGLAIIDAVHVTIRILDEFVFRPSRAAPVGNTWNDSAP
jgi:Carboxypeptidase regulatory-like domain